MNQKEDNDEKQESLLAYCKLENRQTSFVTVVSDSEKIVCCSCPYQTTKTAAKRSKEDKEEKLKESVWKIWN